MLLCQMSQRLIRQSGASRTSDEVKIVDCCTTIRIIQMEFASRILKTERGQRLNE